MERRRIDRAVLALWCRELGALLRLEVPALSALEVVAQEIEPLAAATVALQTAVQGGDSLARRIAGMHEVFPPVVRAAVLTGEATGRLPEALSAAGDCLAEQARLNVTPTTAARLAELAEQTAPAPAVLLARRLLGRAIELGAPRLRITGGAQGGTAEAEVGGRWEVLEQVEPEVFGALCRRVKLMADIPYWIVEPAVGTIHLNTAEQGTWTLAVQAIPDDDGVGQHIEMTVIARERE